MGELLKFHGGISDAIPVVFCEGISGGNFKVTVRAISEKNTHMNSWIFEGVCLSRNDFLEEFLTFDIFI